MKNKLFRSMLFIGITGIIVTSLSCNKKIDEAYLNPNASVVEPIESLLPGVIQGFTYFYSSNGSGYGLVLDGTFIGRYLQYWGIQTNGDSWGQMAMIGGSVDNSGSVWATVYFGQGPNVNKIIQWGTEQQKWDYVGVAWAIRAWGWLELTDEYSDGILKEAFNTNLQQFHYDTQPEFYDSCRAICFRALDFLNRTGGGVSQANLALGDAFFYKGDVNKWKKFVYGILARSYINLSSKDLYKTNNYGDSAIKYASLSITTNDDNALVRVAGGPSSAVNNYWGPYRGNIGSFRQAAYTADLMSGNNKTAFKGVFDPRAWYMLSENYNGTFKGFTPWLGSSGLSANDYPKNYWRDSTRDSKGFPSSVSPQKPDSSRYLYQNTSPWPIMTASEMQFIIAEAAYKKGDKVTALAAYKNAISLNFEMLTTTYPQNIPAGKEITPASKAAYLSNPAIVPDTPDGLTLTHIMLQKYIALYVWGTQETWVDMRKYHYDRDVDPFTGSQVYANFTPPSGTNLYLTNNGKLIYRFRPRYNSEYLYDVPELTRIGAYQNADYNTYEMWFSQK